MDIHSENWDHRTFNCGWIWLYFRFFLESIWLFFLVCCCLFSFFFSLSMAARLAILSLSFHPLSCFGIKREIFSLVAFLRWLLLLLLPAPNGEKWIKRTLKQWDIPILSLSRLRKNFFGGTRLDLWLFCLAATLRVVMKLLRAKLGYYRPMNESVNSCFQIIF